MLSPLPNEWIKKGACHAAETASAANQLKSVNCFSTLLIMLVNRLPFCSDICDTVSLPGMYSSTSAQHSVLKKATNYKKTSDIWITNTIFLILEELSQPVWTEREAKSSQTWHRHKQTQLGLANFNMHF